MSQRRQFPHSGLVARILPPLAVLACLIDPSSGWAQSRRDEVARESSSGSGDETCHVLFLGAEGPVWLELQFVGQQQGIDAVRQRYADVMIRSVDSDGDGMADATEAARLPLSGRTDDDEWLGERWREFDTMPEDGRLSAEEYLEAIQPMLGPRLTLRRRPSLLVQSVQLFSRLDRNEDRQISEHELTEGTSTLGQFDFDNDGTFSPAELQPFPQAMVDAAMVSDSGGQDQPFVLLGGEIPDEEVIARMLATYGDGRGEILQKRSGLSEFAFSALDVDGSGGLDAAELQTMIERPRPAAEISIHLAAQEVTLERARSGGPQMESSKLEKSRRPAVRLGAELVEFSAHDNRYGASDQINLLRIRFLQGDADKNGYMGPDEFPSLMGLDASFEDVDADGDGKVFLEELDRFLRRESYLAQCAMEMEVESVEKPLFRILDANLDRRLTSREFAAGPERMREFDLNEDGLLDATELQALRRFRVRFAFTVPPAVRLERNSQMRANQRMPIVNRTMPSGPNWFQNMDRNQDGDVTWREFLGPKEAFGKLDADGNGWIDEEEATRGVSD